MNSKEGRLSYSHAGFSNHWNIARYTPENGEIQSSSSDDKNWRVKVKEQLTDSVTYRVHVITLDFCVDFPTLC